MNKSIVLKVCPCCQVILIVDDMILTLCWWAGVVYLCSMVYTTGLRESRNILGSSSMPPVFKATTRKHDIHIST